VAREENADMSARPGERVIALRQAEMIQRSVAHSGANQELMAVKVKPRHMLRLQAEIQAWQARRQSAQAGAARREQRCAIAVVGVRRRQNGAATTAWLRYVKSRAVLC